MFRMRRALTALLLVFATVGLAVVPVGAITLGTDINRVQLSFDFSDNNGPASASAGAFNIITDVLPEHTPGVVRMVAIAPSDSGAANLTCRFQDVSDSQVECAFNFTVIGTWEIRSQYAISRNDDISSVAVTNINVGS
jgi:hypothetical protein